MTSDLVRSLVSGLRAAAPFAGRDWVCTFAVVFGGLALVFG